MGLPVFPFSLLIELWFALINEMHAIRRSLILFLLWSAWYIASISPRFHCFLQSALSYILGRQSLKVIVYRRTPLYLTIDVVFYIVIPFVVATIFCATCLLLFLMWSFVQYISSPAVWLPAHISYDYPPPVGFCFLPWVWVPKMLRFLPNFYYYFLSQLDVCCVFFLIEPLA